MSTFAQTWIRDYSTQCTILKSINIIFISAFWGSSLVLIYTNTEEYFYQWIDCQLCGFEGFSAVTMKSTTFWKVMSNSLAEFHRRFGGTYCVYQALLSTCSLLISCLIYGGGLINIWLYKVTTSYGIEKILHIPPWAPHTLTTSLF
jgi:hypothetical protein